MPTQQKKAVKKTKLTKVKQSKRPAGRTGRVTKDSEEMKLLRKNVDSKKTGVRKTRKQRDATASGSAKRSAVKKPRSTTGPRSTPGKVGKAFGGVPMD
jgi:hypothetical protein